MADNAAVCRNGRQESGKRPVGNSYESAVRLSIWPGHRLERATRTQGHVC